jgi:hypothetical protein
MLSMNWLNALPDVDPAELRRDALRVIPGRRRERRWPSLGLPGAVALPAILVAVALAIVSTRWLLARRWQTPVPAELEPAVQDPEDFDRDAVIRAATEGMEAFDFPMAPATVRDAGVA